MFSFKKALGFGYLVLSLEQGPVPCHVGFFFLFWAEPCARDLSTWEKYQEEKGGIEEGGFSPLGLALLKQFAAGFSATCLLIT